MNIDGTTRVYGIIGNPVAHSLSPLMHNRAFAACGENRVYVPLPTGDLAAGVQGLRALSIDGASVTVPFKEQVMDLLDEVDPLAQRIGAVNTIAVRREGGVVRLYGTNTDWLGSNRALQDHVQLGSCRAVILGAGGAARAIGFGLLEAGAKVEIKSRDSARGRLLAAQLGADWSPLDRPPLESAEIVVNATSVGMEPDDQRSPLGQDLVEGYRVVMDIVYAPLQTQLLKDAGAHGCTCINGLEMLLHQGAAQFELWTGREAPVEIMRGALQEAVGG